VSEGRKLAPEEPAPDACSRSRELLWRDDRELAMRARDALSRCGRDGRYLGNL